MSKKVKLTDEPTEAEISRAAWAWRNDKDRETDSSDDAYFRHNWRSLPGLRAYVQAQIDLGRPLHDALAGRSLLEGDQS